MATGRNSTGCFLLRKLFAAGGCYTGTASNRCRWVSPSPLSLSLQLAVPPSTTTPVTRSRCWYCGSGSSLARIRLPTTNGSSSSSSSCSSITAKPSIGDTFRWSGIPDASGTELHALARRLGTTTTTKVKSSVLPKHSDDDDDNYDDGGGNDGLRRNTREWLRIPVGIWTRREISRGRFLIRQWSEVRGDARERAVQQTRILRRWMRERLAAAAAAAAAVETTTSTTIGDGESDGNDRSAVDTDSNELIEMLNRCLDSWRKASSRAIMTSPANINNTNPTEQSRSNPAADSSNRTSPSSESMKLMNLFWDASAALDDKKIRPCPKTCSMCMNVLALHPESPTACDDVLMVLERCRREQEATTDLRFYNVCLHTLAKCATHHPEAPHLVESIVQEMTAGSRSSTTHRSLNTACFVSLLHAWANTIPMSASATATASVSVDASASFSIAAGSPRKGGSNSETTAPLPAERIEAILDQMIRSYPHLVDTICFNICIDAWGKQGQPDKAESVLWRLHGYHRDSSERRNRRDESETETESFPQIINRKNPRERQIRPNNVSYNSAINAWAKCGSNRSSGGKWDVVEAANRVELLLGHMRRHGYELTPETVGSAMEAYAGAPNPGRKVQGLLDELETMYSEGELSFSPPKVCYLMAIRAWGRTRSVGAERAEFLVQRMTELSSRDNDNDDGGSRSDLEPCVVVYTALLSAWAVSDAADAPERALRVFREMHRRASSSSGQSVASPNTISLNALLEAFCNHDRAEEARSLLVRVKHKVQPNSRSYHILLKGYAESKDPRAVEAAEELLRELESDYRNGAGGGIKPTAALYSQLLVAWGNSTRHDGAFRAEEIFWSMLRQDDDRISVRPDTTTLNCVLRAWSKSFEGGNAERAEAFLRKVQTEHSEDGLTADPVSYRHLIYAWAHSRRKQAPQRAEEHLDNALRLCASRSSTGTHPGWKLTRAHFKGVILAWEKSSDPNAPQHIQRLRDEMVRIFSK